MTTDLEDLLQKVASEVESEGLLHLVKLPPRLATTVDPDPPLPQPLRRALQVKGISGLWKHQADALAAVRRGSNVIVSTGTASGKSLCFNLPTFEKILHDDKQRALYLYPTKALAQDQLRAIRAFGIPKITAATYDGDTPSDERAAVRRYARIVLSNPDMLHFGILPTHRNWAEFLAHLAFVVVDEAHILRGVFGSHTGCILRRLRRIASHYGSCPQFLLTSATIGNPSVLAEGLLGEPFEVIDEDASPRGPRLFGFWNPPWVDESAGIRGSTNWESARLMSSFVDNGVSTLAFSKSRKGAELIAKHARRLVSPDKEQKIKAYRAGYLAEERREIEKQIFSGELEGVAATSALELGVDIGGLDAVVISGFPGTVSQVWQQAGRAGRSGKTSVAVLVGQDDPLDQYYMTHPDILLTKPFEAALVDTTNPNILRPHMGSAAYEMPIPVEQVEEMFGEGTGALADSMVRAGDLVVRKVKGVEQLHWKRREPPARDIDLRSIGGGSFAIVEDSTGALLGSVDGARALQQIHPGAIYLHQGDNFEVRTLDLQARVALVERADVGYYTQSREISDITILEEMATKPVGRVQFYLGRVEVTEQVVAFVRKDISTGQTLDIVELELPPNILQTVSFWYTVDPSVVVRAKVGPKELPGSLHAAEHAAIGLLPLFAMADRWDIGGLSTAYMPQTGLPTVFIYDGYPGGAGIAERGFAQAEEHLSATLEAVSNCICERGCPSCVQSPKCGNGNDPLDKSGAVRLMGTILEKGK